MLTTSIGFKKPCGFFSERPTGPPLSFWIPISATVLLISKILRRRMGSLSARKRSVLPSAATDGPKRRSFWYRTESGSISLLASVRVVRKRVASGLIFSQPTRLRILNSLTRSTLCSGVSCRLAGIRICRLFRLIRRVSRVAKLPAKCSMF